MGPAAAKKRSRAAICRVWEASGVIEPLHPGRRLVPDWERDNGFCPGSSGPLRTERNGQALRLVRYATGQDNIDDARYRPLL